MEALDWLADQVLPADADWNRRAMVMTSLAWFYDYLLVFVRVSGLFLVGPLFGRGVVPPSSRVLLIIVLSLVLVPTLPQQAERGFHLLDRNGDGELVESEIPAGMAAQFKAKLKSLNRENGGLFVHEWSQAREIPQTVLDLSLQLGSELLIGLLLGMGVMIVLSAFQMAGEMIDQQIGTSLGGVFNPGLDISGGPSGRLLFLFGTALLLTIEIPPIGIDDESGDISGHLVMVDGVVHTFRTMPPGTAFITEPSIRYVVNLVHGSLVLALQVAAPVLAAMTLVALMMGTLGYTVPQVNVLLLGFPLRAIVAIGVMMFAMTGAAVAAAEAIGDVLHELARRLAFAGDSLDPAGG